MSCRCWASASCPFEKASTSPRLPVVSWRASWLVAATVLYTVATLVGAFWYAPVVRAQVVSLRRTGLASEDYRTLEQRMKATGSAMLIAVLAVLYLMVTKPQLW